MAIGIDIVVAPLSPVGEGRVTETKTYHNTINSPRQISSRFGVFN